LFFLLSEDIGCYGKDIGTGITELLRMLFQAGRDNDFKIVISNFNAQRFIEYYEELKAVFIKNKDKILFIQIPIQSGSNRILELMNRRYCVEDLDRCLKDIKQAIPSLNITTDMIAGFPGETENDFQESLDFLKRNKFRYADIFGYEDRPDTLANSMNNKVPQEVIERRKIGLLGIQNENSSLSSIFKKIIEVSRCVDHL
jgi:tRNA A37 methylthiotransferase MiaB